MNEPVGNIVYVCGHHFDEITKETLNQIKKKKIKIKTGDLIKTRFDDGKYKEHMWVKIEGLIGDKIMGKLNNEPIYITSLNYGNIVETNINSITGYVSSDGKVTINPLYDKIEEKK